MALSYIQEFLAGLQKAPEEATRADHKSYSGYEAMIWYYQIILDGYLMDLETRPSRKVLKLVPRN